LGTALAHIELGLAEISNKEDAVTVFVSVEAAHLPADIDRRSPLIAGSSPPARLSSRWLPQTSRPNRSVEIVRRDAALKTLCIVGNQQNFVGKEHLSRMIG